MKSSFRVTQDIPQLDHNDIEIDYINGSDGWFRLNGAENLTPQSSIAADSGLKDNFFSHFNDNKDRSNLFFGNDYDVFATATANDGSIKRNLTLYEINQFLSDSNGKGVTFHFGVHYIKGIDSSKQSWEDQIGNKQIAEKDVVVLPYKEATSNNGGSTNTGNNTNTNTNTNKDTDTNTNTKPNETKPVTTPAVSYNSVFTTTGLSTSLYNDNGKLVRNRALAANTAWKVDKKKVINGVTYYRVATGEWAKEANVLEIQTTNSVVTTNKQTTLYNSEGKMIKNRALAANTAWRSDRTAKINGQTMYRVATNEWVPANDIK